MDLYNIMERISKNNNEFGALLIEYYEEEDSDKRNNLGEQIYPKTFEFYRNYLALIDEFRRYKPFLPEEEFQENMKDLEKSADLIGELLLQFDEVVD